ncbi:MAG: DUF6576 domain-containing protein [Phycisphaerales bacterium]
MSWSSEPPEPQGFAGDFRAPSPRFESPLTWSLPLVRLGPVAIRVHGAFLLLIAVECLRSSLPGSGRVLGFGPTLVVLGSFLVLSLLHEAARWWAMRRGGWDLDEWLLWPLGGLAGPAASELGPASARTELAGVVAIGGVGLLAGGALYLLRGDVWGTAIPEPWSWDGFARLSLAEAGLITETLFLFQWTVVVMVALNLVPAFPLAAGRALAARWIVAEGWSVGLIRAARLGTACSVAMLVAGLAFGAWTLTFASLLLWSAARETLVRVRDSDGFQEPPAVTPARKVSEAEDQAELDRILEKINRSGMESLSFRERRRLKSATRRRREGEGPIR